MNTAIRRLLFASVFLSTLLACLPAVYGQAGDIANAEQFRETVSFEVTLSELNRAAQAAGDDLAALQELTSRVLIIEGTAAAVSVFSMEENDFYVELELVSGNWQGLEDIEVHSAIVVLDDPSFAKRVAARVPRDPPPELILRNDRVLVAGRLVSVAQSDDGERLPVLQAYAVRPIR